MSDMGCRIWDVVLRWLMRDTADGQQTTEIIGFDGSPLPAAINSEHS